MQNIGTTEGDKRMSEQEMLKVYELAKELGIDSISLLDKLKSLNIKVKNHMSELREDEVQIARNSLRKDLALEKKSHVKTRKKGGEMASSIQATDTGAGEKRASSPIIRRRFKAEGMTDTPISPNRLAHETAPAHPAELKEVHPAEESSTMEEMQQEATSSQVGDEIHISKGKKPSDKHQPTAKNQGLDHEVSDDSSAGPLAQETLSSSHAIHAKDHPAVHHATAPDLTSSEASEERTRPSGIKVETLASSSPASSHAPFSPETHTRTPAPGPQHGTPPKKGAMDQTPGMAAPSVKSTGTPTPLPKATRAPIILPPRPVAPRKSILKIVEPTPPPPRPIIKPVPPTQTAGGTQKPVVKGTTTQDKDGFRIIKMTKENLDQMVEEEAAKKRGGAREQDLRPEDVRFADYRKKELVFLPKKKKIPVGKEIKKTVKTMAKAQKRIVTMEDFISVQDLANQLSVKATDVIRKLMSMGQMATINQSLDFDTATLIAAEYQYEVKNVAFNEGTLLEAGTDDTQHLKPRPPIVTIMGHVDHGKTTLLDAIREANVAAGEAGGITQHIGAYTVEKNGKWITFIDTPGHEAFTVMRARGANVTDIVILVVSADDGVMPQTREALSHAQAAKVPIIVAVNKIDKPGSNPEKIKQALAELNLLAEDWGGETIFVPVSALKRTNLDKLLDAILLQAEMLDLKASTDTQATGTVLEARLEKGKGPVVSVLVRRGTLHIGDAIVAGPFAGKIKAMADHRGHLVESVTPGIAVEILGLEGVPNAGETFHITETEADARKIAENRVEKHRNKTLVNPGKVSLEDLFAKIQTGDVKELSVILKADAFGSVEAIRDSLIKLSTDKVKVKPILTAAGGITESDVLLASASNAIIIGFNVRPETKARQLAEAEHTEVKCYNIIYELLDDVKKAMTGLLDKKKVEKFLGRAEVRQTFTVPKIGTIAGSSVIDGKMIRGANIRLLRDSRIIYEGKMSSLRRFKDDAKEVASGFECGIGIENYNDLKSGDIIEAYQIELVTPELS